MKDTSASASGVVVPGAMGALEQLPRRAPMADALVDSRKIKTSAGRLLERDREERASISAALPELSGRSSCVALSRSLSLAQPDLSGRASDMIDMRSASLSCHRDRECISLSMRAHAGVCHAA